MSSAGLHPQQKIVRGTFAIFSSQAQFSEAIKKEHGIDTPTGLLVGAVGQLNTGPVANEVLERNMADVTFVGRQFQKEPGTVLAFAEQLGVEIEVANQIRAGFLYKKIVMSPESNHAKWK